MQDQEPQLSKKLLDLVSKVGSGDGRLLPKPRLLVDKLLKNKLLKATLPLKLPESEM